MKRVEKIKSLMNTGIQYVKETLQRRYKEKFSVQMANKTHRGKKKQN